MTKLTALFLISLTAAALSEPIPYAINTKKWSHVLDDHFISITINPTDLLQGRVYGLQMNSTMAILKGLAPAYVRIGSADTAKYTFKRSRYPSDVVKPDDEYTVTETHWMVFNEVAKQAGLDVIVCLNAAHRTEGTKKWDTRNSLELISFSDSKGYNLTWQLGYEIQGGDDLSGIQFGKDLNRLRTILNAFPRYQQAKLVGPDIRVIHKKEDIDFWNDVLIEAGPTLDAVTWHPRWPQPSKMKVSDNSELGYEFPIDYLEWDRSILNKILQKSIFKNPVWIGETKRESTGTFAEGLLWARRLVLAAKSGVEVVMKHPNLMDITHPKPEYWIALLHKRLLGKAVLETRSVGNNTELSVISHCTNPYYWSDKPERLQDGPVSVYAVNMGGTEQRIQIKGTWTGKSQLLFQYVLTSGSDPDSVFSQMTYLNGEPLMMTDDGLLPDLIPKVKKVEKGPTMKLPPYSVGFWVIPEAKVKICQLQPQTISTINIETLAPSSALKSPKTLDNIRDINQFMVEKLKNPESESEEVPKLEIEEASYESSEKDISKENRLPRVARRIRDVGKMDEINQQLKTIMKETQEFLSAPEGFKSPKLNPKLHKANPNVERKIQGLAEDISTAIKYTNQEQEFNKFLEDSGLKQDFGSLIINDRRINAPGMKNFLPYFHSQNPEGHLDDFEVKERLRRSILDSDEYSQESIEEEDDMSEKNKFDKKISLVAKDENKRKNKKADLIIPHQPDLRGLEERYKQIVESKIKDGKRKIDDIKRKIQDETDIVQKIKSPEIVQEEIIKKEIELLEKTEETVADILKTQKRRQETFEDIIFDELEDVKTERMRELEEMQRKQDNSIVKRHIQQPFSKPLLKTVEYIEKNFNLEPEGVQKIKRSLEERMGEMLRSYDVKKSMEVQKRMVPSREEKKFIIKKFSKDGERKGDKYEMWHRSDRRQEKDDFKGFSKERSKEKNIIKKPLSKHIKRSQESEKYENLKKPFEYDDDDSFELFNKNKLSEPVKKSERKLPVVVLEEKKSQKKISSKLSRKENSPEVDDESKELNKNFEKKIEKVEEHYEKKKSIKEKPKSVKEEPAEPQPLKHDKERRENMLKQITLMVEGMNSNEHNSNRREDEDISVEFESERRPRGIKRIPRQADLSEYTEKMEEKPAVVEDTVDKPTEELNKYSKHRKYRVRGNKKHKELRKLGHEDSQNDDSQQKKRHLMGLDRPHLEFDRKKLIKPKLRKLNPKFHVYGNELQVNDKPEMLEIPIQEEEISKQNGDVLKQDEETTQQLEEPMKQKEEISKLLEENLKQKVESLKPSENILTKKEQILNLSGEKQELIKSEKMKVEDTKTIKENTNKSQPEFLEKENDIKTKPTVNSNEEPKQDLEELIEEKVFLEEGSERLKEKSEINGKEKLENKTEITQLEETTTPTEGYIIVDPTEDFESNEKITEKTLGFENEKNDSKTKQKTEPEIKAKEEEESKAQIIMKSKVKEAGEPKESDSSEEFVTLTKLAKEKFVDQKSSIENNDSTSSSSEEIESKEEVVGEMLLPNADSSQRKRRATFLTKRHEESDNEDDYSSEERIEKFKQMIYRNSPAKRASKNEVRSTGGIGMGADDFLKMAGSTFRVMFDDVIPEAYGQTKNKIQNMGITEYIKEFGKIVQQMKNLDQIFLNIGEAAVKGYIRSNKAEKGPNIQVISRKKRDLNNEETLLPSPETKKLFEKEIMQSSDQNYSDFTSLMSKEKEKRKDASFDYARTSSDRKITAGPRDSRENNWDVSSTSRELGKNILKNNKTYRFETTQITETTANNSNKEKTKTTKAAESLDKDNVKDISENKENEDLQNDSNSLRKILDIQFRKKIDHSEFPMIFRENAVNKVSALVPEDLQKRIFSPWIKTTKDFIHQAITTLRRQKELSEILANDLMNRDLTKKVIKKREAKEEEPNLPVYHTVSQKGNKKREAEMKQSDESLIRHLRGLQPGVYIVPTEEMTNIRSEQITNEAKQKSGMPNVVTLNIYYDKKNADPSGKTESTDTKITQDAVTYLQNKVWDATTNQYLTVPNGNVAPVAPTLPLQTQVVYSAAPRAAELPNSRLIQYPPQTYHYPPVPKMYPPVVPNPPIYSPMYYLSPEARFASLPPGTKRQWREFRSRASGVPYPTAIDSGWNIQYELPSGAKGSAKTIIPSSYNKNFKYSSQDKKRSVGDFKAEPTWSETALPFWKFFSTSEKEESEESDSEKEERVSSEVENSEDVLKEKKKGSQEFEEKKEKSDKKNSNENVTKKTPKKEEEDDDEEELVEDEELGEEEKDKKRKRRSIENLSREANKQKIAKRSYEIEFRDHDILPEWFGTYQEIGNNLDTFPPHVRRSHIVSTPWSEEDQELLNILEADDELSLYELENDDYYYSNDNSIQHLRRYPRSTDQLESNMIKTNMIYKMPMDGDHVKPKGLGMMGVKKLTDEDSSLEGITKLDPMEIKPPVFLDMRTPSSEEIRRQEQELMAQKFKRLWPQNLQQMMPEKMEELIPEKMIPENMREFIPKEIRELFPEKMRKIIPGEMQPVIPNKMLQMTPEKIPQVLPGIPQPVIAKKTTVQPGTKDSKLMPRNPNDDSFYYFFKYAYDSFVKVMKSMKDFF